MSSFLGIQPHDRQKNIHETRYKDTDRGKTAPYITVLQAIKNYVLYRYKLSILILL